MKPKYWVLVLSSASVLFTLGTVISQSLVWIALGTVVGYVSQGLFVVYTTGRKPWELLFGIVVALISIASGYLALQFLGRVVFIANAAHTAYALMDKEETRRLNSLLGEDYD